MDMKNFAIGTLAGAVAAFFLAFILYEPVLGGFFAEHTSMPNAKDPPDFLWLILGSIGWGALFTLIFMRWASISTFMTGLKAGALIGGLVGLSMDFEMYGLSTSSDMAGMIVDILVWVVRFGLTGAVIGFVLGKMDTRS